MFIYLDHAHFSALDQLFRRSPDAFAKFVEFWLEHGCKLIVSRAHLHEIGQSVDERDVEKRLEMLRYFSIWSGAEDENVDWVIIREIRHQTLHRLQDNTAAISVPYLPIREALYRRVDLASIAKFVWSSRRGFLADQRSRREFAQFENRSITLRKKFRELTKQKKPKWNPEAWKMMPFVESVAPKASGDPVADRWLAEVNARRRRCYERAKRERQALICLYDLEGLVAVERAPEQDLSRLGFFRALAKHWVAPYCRHAKYDPERIQAALDEFDPYDAPAISYSLAVERGRKLHEKDYKASDYMDVDHVLWAAYADLAFIDKRTHGFLLQARKSQAAAQLLSPHLSVRYERAGGLDEVRKQITRLAVERSRDTGQ